MAGAMSRGQIFANLFVEGEQSHSIALQIEEIGQCSCQRGGVFRFGVAQRTETHRAAVVREQIAAQIGFVFKFFDEITIAAGENAPIDITRIIALGVLPIFGELDGEAVIRTAMKAVPKSLDNDPRAQFEVADVHQRLWADEGTAARVCGGSEGGVTLWAGGLAGA